MADFSSSRWDTTYNSPGGLVRAIVSFANDKGIYNLIDSGNSVYDSGTMDNVKYNIATDTVWFITGRWHLDGITGTFQFNSNGGPNAFKGGWLLIPPQTGGDFWEGIRI
jgi:hypothetical protein